MSESEAATVGVVLVGHGRTASELLHAARGIVGEEPLRSVIPVDAGMGETPDLGQALCDVLDRADEGQGVLVLVDLLGASPCNCAQREAGEHRVVTLSGLNLAMLLKLAALSGRGLDVEAMAEACADSGRRAVAVRAQEPCTPAAEPTAEETPP